MTFKIMLVDDEPANLRLLGRLFRHDYQVLAASSGAEALRLLEQHDVALLISDQRMPGMTGTELLKRAASLRPNTVRIILTGYTDIDSLVEAINSGQVYRYITKPWDNDNLRLTVMRALQHYQVNKSRHEMGEVNKRLARRVRAMSEGVTRAVVDALEAKDRYVCGHSRRVRGYAAAIGRRLSLGADEIEQLSLAALLHDIGKISLPDSILLKPGALTEEEFAAVRMHTWRGERMLAEAPDMEDVAAAVRHHHEDYDGTGYPGGLEGERIPLHSRIIRVADAYDAMTSPRPFRDALSHEEAVAELIAGSGTQFDPKVVSAFCGLEALAKIRAHIARGDFGSRLLSIMPVTNLRELPEEALVREIELEPVFAALTLRAANAGRAAGGTTANLPAACARLGLGALREIVARDGAHGTTSYEAELLRDHSIRCATAARLLAERTGILDPDAAYTAGLLHDIGEAMLRSLFPEEFEQIEFDHSLRCEREVAAFGVDHGQVGQWIVEACNIPHELAFAVQTLHDVNLVNDPAALLLHLADRLAEATDVREVTSLDALTPDRLAMLRLTRTELARIYEHVTGIIGERFDSVAA
jgi:putative nucleotidyltransferase with HDIG domain